MPRERLRRKKKAKEWYTVLAPQMFGKAKVAETIADEPEKTIGRNVEVSLQDLTNDFSKSHIKLTFKIVETTGHESHTIFMGHSLTADYVKRMSRRHRAKVDAVFKVETKDGVRMRLKPSALAGKRLQSSQKRAIRSIIIEAMRKEASRHRFTSFVKLMLDGELGKLAYKDSKAIYPVKRVEVYKSEIMEANKVRAVAEEEAERAAAEAEAAAEEEAEAAQEPEAGPEKAAEEPAEAGDEPAEEPEAPEEAEPEEETEKPPVDEETEEAEPADEAAEPEEPAEAGETPDEKPGEPDETEPADEPGEADEEEPVEEEPEDAEEDAKQD
ncbi:MAG: 30S ribosomal protein S3ae [Thermoplasmatota archaeon]